MLLRINVCSLQKNFDLLYEFTESLNLLPPIISLLETKLKKEPLTNIELTTALFMLIATLMQAD